MQGSVVCCRGPPFSCRRLVSVFCLDCGKQWIDCDTVRNKNRNGNQNRHKHREGGGKGSPRLLWADSPHCMYFVIFASSKYLSQSFCRSHRVTSTNNIFPSLQNPPPPPPPRHMLSLRACFLLAFLSAVSNRSLELSTIIRVDLMYSISAAVSLAAGEDGSEAPSRRKSQGRRRHPPSLAHPLFSGGSTSERFSSAWPPFGWCRG